MLTHPDPETTWFSCTLCTGAWDEDVPVGLADWFIKAPASVFRASAMADWLVWLTPVAMLV